jgi:hypothetical protein
MPAAPDWERNSLGGFTWVCTCMYIVSCRVFSCLTRVSCLSVSALKHFLPFIRAHAALRFWSCKCVLHCVYACIHARTHAYLIHIHIVGTAHHTHTHTHTDPGTWSQQAAITSGFGYTCGIMDEARFQYRPACKDGETPGLTCTQTSKDRVRALCLPHREGACFVPATPRGCVLCACHTERVRALCLPHREGACFESCLVPNPTSLRTGHVRAWTLAFVDTHVSHNARAHASRCRCSLVHLAFHLMLFCGVMCMQHDKARRNFLRTYFVTSLMPCMYSQGMRKSIWMRITCLCKCICKYTHTNVSAHVRAAVHWVPRPKRLVNRLA